MGYSRIINTYYSGVKLFIYNVVKEYKEVIEKYFGNPKDSRNIGIAEMAI
jgi:hypothetical protein